MTDSLALEFEMRKKKITKRSMAKLLNLSELGFARKLANITEFKASEIKLIQNILELDTVTRDSIFFKNIAD